VRVRAGVGVVMQDGLLTLCYLFSSPECDCGGDPVGLQTRLPEAELQAHRQSAQTDSGETAGK